MGATMQRWLALVFVGILAACSGGTGPEGDAGAVDAPREADAAASDAQGDTAQVVDAGDASPGTDVTPTPDVQLPDVVVPDTGTDAVAQDASDGGCFAYPDHDGDGYGVSPGIVVACDGTAPAGYALASGDCDDTRATVHPGATELCDGVDENCDGYADNEPYVPPYTEGPNSSNSVCVQIGTSTGALGSGGNVRCMGPGIDGSTIYGITFPSLTRFACEQLGSPGGTCWRDTGARIPCS